MSTLNHQLRIPLPTTLLRKNTKIPWNGILGNAPPPPPLFAIITTVLEKVISAKPTILQIAPLMALEAMLHKVMSDQLADRPSEVTPSETGPVEATGNERVPPRTSKTELDTLAHFRRHTQKTGFSERAANYGSQIPQNRHDGHLWFPTAPILQIMPGEPDWSSLGIAR